MNKNLKIYTDKISSLVLRSINIDDIENLRTWKNENCKAFFHQDPIDSIQQRKWFLGYTKDLYNHMFIIEYDSLGVGCIGFRLLGDIADIYNVILGKIDYKNKGLMSQAIKALCMYIINNYTNQITVKVVDSNIIAKKFYLKNGFIVKAKRDNHIEMSLSSEHFIPMEIRVC
ncbi:MAG: GNAT family N-acetyltransferase [Candidatus Omnitrophota bacterium]